MSFSSRLPKLSNLAPPRATPVATIPLESGAGNEVIVTAVVTVFSQGLSRSTTATIGLLDNAFGGTVVSDHYSTCNNLPIQQRHLCWAHLIRDLTAIAEHPGAST